MNKLDLQGLYIDIQKSLIDFVTEQIQAMRFTDAAQAFQFSVGEGIAVSGDIHGPIEIVLFVKDGGGKDLFVAIEYRGEQHACGMARGGIAHGIVIGGVFIEAGGKDDAVAIHEFTYIVDAHIVISRDRLCSDIAIASHIIVANF